MKRPNASDDSTAKGTRKTAEKRARSIPNADADAKVEKETPDVDSMRESAMLSILSSKKAGASC